MRGGGQLITKACRPSEFTVGFRSNAAHPARMCNPRLAWTGAAACVLLLASAVQGQSAGTPVDTPVGEGWSLAYRAPEGCPSEHEFRAQVEASLERAPRGMAVTVSVEHLAAGYRLELGTVIADRSGQRQLDDLDCHALVVTAASIVGWSVASEARIEPPAATVEESPARASGVRDDAPPARGPAQTKAQPRVSEPHPTRRETTWLLGAGPSSALGVAPAATLGLQVFLAWVERDFELGLVAWGSPPLDYQVGVDRAAFQDLGGALLPCMRWNLALHWATSGCGEVAVDWIRAEQVTSDARGSAASLGLGAALGLDWKLSEAVLLRASGSLRAAVVAAQLVEREGELQREWWNSPTVGGRVGLAAAIVF
jgi:hypothetical protein